MYVRSIGDVRDATTQMVGVLLMVTITALMVLLLLLLFGLPSLSWGYPAEPPAIFEIRSILHYDETGTRLNYDSRIILAHAGTESCENDLLRAEIYVNNNPVPCRITTMNGYHFISTHHTGVERMWGYGCQTNRWNPSEKTGIDLTDGTIHPGDLVRVDISDTLTGRIVSRHSATA